MPDQVYLVSACLAGVCSRYDGSNNRHPAVEVLARARRAVPACPEQLGGLPTPRPPAEIVPGGSGSLVLEGKAAVCCAGGQDVTAAFLRGAEQMLLIARLYAPAAVILKEGSPSCGLRRIYDGSFQGRDKAGTGVTAALLLREGFTVYSEEDFSG